MAENNWPERVYAYRSGPDDPVAGFVQARPGWDNFPEVQEYVPANGRISVELTEAIRGAISSAETIKSYGTDDPLDFDPKYLEDIDREADLILSALRAALTHNPEED